MAAFLLFLPRWQSLLVLLSLLLIPCYSFPLLHPRIRRNLFIISSSSANTDQSPPAALVLCIGDALLDCIANDDARGWSVEQLTQKNAWTAFPGGAPANVATACVKLETFASFCGCVGTDADGDLLEHILSDAGVDVSLLQRTDKLPTRRVMVTRSLEGDREFGGFHDNRAADEFADCLLDASLLFPKADDVLKRCKWIVCSTLSLAFPKSSEAVKMLVEKGLQQGVKLLVDVNWRPVFWKQPESEARLEIMDLVQKAHVVKLTDEEAEWLFGIPAAEALDDPRRVHDEFPEAEAVLVTAGEKGASYSLFGCTGQAEAFNVDVVETTGAGDAFTAGFLHALSMVGDDVDSLSQKERQQLANDVIRFASAVGALTCTKEGAIAAQPTFDQVESFLIHGEKVWS